MNVRRGLAGFVLAGLSAGTLTISAVLGAPSAFAAPTDCPTALPTASAVKDLLGTGYTVETGKTADPFTAKVLGRITNGIAPGVDMIMAEVASPALDRAGGVWAGMSGSPVYTADGKLIGAVAYGLSFAPSKIAGITPAAEMMKLLNAPAAAAAEMPRPEAIAAPADAAAVLRAVGVPAAAAAGGFARLKLPLSISGGTGAGADKLLAKLEQQVGAKVFGGGGSTKGAPAAAAKISAGSNFTAAVSYGDVTFAGTGTTTFVCNGRAVAFGHPFLNRGAVALSMHEADALFVQPDAVFGPFKVANPGGIVGTVDGDRLTGITGQFGAAPTTIKIVSSLTLAGQSTPVVGTTNVVEPVYAPIVSAYHTLYNIDRVLNSGGPGSAALNIKFSGKRADGTAFEIKRSEHFSTKYDLDFTVADQMWALVGSLSDQNFEDIKLERISITGTVSPAQKSYGISAVKVRQNGVFVVPTGPINARAGSTLAVQVTLSPVKGGGAAKTVGVNIRVPAELAGSGGTLVVASGSSQFIWEQLFNAKSLDDLFNVISKAPAGGDVFARLQAGGDGPPQGNSAGVTTKAAAGAYVEPSSQEFEVMIA